MIECSKIHCFNTNLCTIYTYVHMYICAFIGNNIKEIIGTSTQLAYFNNVSLDKS